jgi:hypothetical protein
MATARVGPRAWKSSADHSRLGQIISSIYRKNTSVLARSDAWRSGQFSFALGEQHVGHGLVVLLAREVDPPT